mmetsp:Transcript_78129/g.154864  ORF Transcript_78129/g.154864 Transcript_78129/m.154864 type:complete len:88 (+) Transcript_78129:60-323(+)
MRSRTNATAKTEAADYQEHDNHEVPYWIRFVAPFGGVKEVQTDAFFARKRAYGILEPLEREEILIGLGAVAPKTRKKLKLISNITFP